MQNLRLFILAASLGLIVAGCRKDTTDTQTKEIEGKDQIRKEAAMGITLQWLGHASFKICHEDTVIYIDPWKLKDSPHDATLVLVSHSHYDHYSAEDIAKVSGPDTKLVASADVIAKEKAGLAITPGQTIEIGSVRVTGVAAYNPNKQFHPKSNSWVGFVIELGSKRIYYAGDTDLTDEMKALKDIDVALLPVGGTYTMNAGEAAKATERIKPERAIPYHWGDIVGGRADAEAFSKAAECEVQILSPGETISLD
ncbi:MAG: MBL fold metallo-hydrolase [Sedimentisphaerales bacterium]|nr:MBL fold metallo-hydrolase [Sedimentisphaerales bacterium]